MDLFFLMDTMFDLLNESDGLNVRELEEDEPAGLFYLTTGDGTRVRIHCAILEPDAVCDQKRCAVKNGA